MPPPLLTLPPELLLLILTHLPDDFPTPTHLRATCRALAALIPAQPTTPPDWRRLVAAEDGAWALKRNRLACAGGCARLRHAARFTDREKSRASEASRAWRRCVDCCRREGEERGWTTEAWLERGTVVSAVRRVVVEGAGRVCKGCGNGYLWDGVGGDAGFCRRCERERWAGKRAVMGEGGRVWRDLRRVAGKRGGGWGMDGGCEWELWDARAEMRQGDYGYGYCACCLDDGPFVGWREGWRGVNVVNQ